MNVRATSGYIRIESLNVRFNSGIIRTYFIISRGNNDMTKGQLLYEGKAKKIVYNRGAKRAAC